MEELLQSIANGAAFAAELAAVLVVGYGVLEAFVRTVVGLARRGTGHGQRKAIWRSFGMWLVLGLEFELAADIVRSVIAPTWEDLLKLGAIAVIRTFLNFFLEKDLEKAPAETIGPATSAGSSEASGPGVLQARASATPD
ncbi:MAG: DUF1622 domain-containing protein [Candidatus Eiseniibacteriota bacterium]